jgi:hypothetical protein
MAVDGQAVNDGVEELRALLRPDGADLEIVEIVEIVDTVDRGGRVHLRLDLAKVECVECVIPPDLLEQIVRDGLRRRVTSDLDVVIDDPRRVGQSL